MKFFFHILLLFFLFCSCNQGNKTGDSATEVANRDPSGFEKGNYDTLVRTKYLELAYRANARKNFKEYYRICKKVETESAKIKDYRGMVYASMYIGTYHLNNFSTDSAYYYFTKAEKLSNKIKDNFLMEHLIQYKADILWAQNEYALAESEAIRALKIAMAKKNYLSAYNSCITIANSLAGMNNDDEALEYYNRALQLLDKNKTRLDISYKAYAQNYIAKIYQKQNRHQEVINYLDEYVDLQALKRIDINAYCYIKNTAAYSRFKLGDATAAKTFQETLEIGDSLNFAPIQVTSKSYLGEFYIANKNFTLANMYLSEARTLSHRHRIFEDELQILKLLSESNPHKSGYYTNNYIRLNDSIQIVERATRNKFARIEFETDEIIAEKNNLNLEKEKVATQRWFIAGIAVLSILLLLLWDRHKLQKAKTRELLLKQEQQKANEEIYQLMLNQQQKIEEGKQIEKQRISLELHDGVMGRLSAIRMNMFPMIMTSSLENKEEFYKHLEDVQSIEKEIRNIAHELNANLFSDNVNFVAIVKELFTKIENHSNIHFELYVDDSVNWDLVNNTIKINLYRILQEALQNIEKYAQANQVSVAMTREEKTIRVSISDNGRGFDTKAQKAGIGLQNMKTRMTELGGEFHIVSEIDKGTKISLTIPI